MSENDKLILDNLAISQALVAKALFVKRQSVSHGIKQKTDYLDIEKLVKLYDHLRNTDSYKAEKLKSYFIHDKPNQHFIKLIEKVSVSIIPNEPENSPDFQTIWIYTSKPYEVSRPHYMLEMKKHFEDEDKTIVYFISPNFSNEFQKRITNKLESFKSQSHAKIYVYVSKCFSFSPHFVIFNPISEYPTGYVQVMTDINNKNDKQHFAQLPNEVTLNIVSSTLTDIFDETYKNIKNDENNFQITKQFSLE